jgi:iron-sulfur cluster repair protein YtfE (RIC family)
MVHSHEQLGDQVTRLLAAMQANARADVVALWNELEHRLLDHMAAEERFVLPTFTPSATNACCIGGRTSGFPPTSFRP